MGTARKHGLYVVEDAAQGVGSFYKGRALGTIGDLGCLSFHETKNVICGEGGALIVNDEKFMGRAEILREKGTNRSQFFRGEVDKYTWVDVGSSYLPSDMVAAFLYSQLENMDRINAHRLALWNEYDAFFRLYDGRIRLPIVPPECRHNAHMYYLLLPTLEQRSAFIAHMKARGINPVFHYVPLHSSPAGRRFGHTPLPMPVTDRIGDTLVRLPLFYGLDEAQMDEIRDGAAAFFEKHDA